MTARILLAGVFAAIVLPRLAIAAEDFPNYDPVVSCTEAARRAGDRQAGPRPECIEVENQARALTSSLWSAQPAGLRQRCIRISDRRKSFVSLDSCLRSNAAGTR